MARITHTANAGSARARLISTPKGSNPMATTVAGVKFSDQTAALLDHAAAHGYRIEPTERGMKITDGEHYAKASGVDERLGRFRLEERFGARLPAEEPREVSPSASAGREAPDRPAAPTSASRRRSGGVRSPQSHRLRREERHLAHLGRIGHATLRNELLRRK